MTQVYLKKMEHNVRKSNTNKLQKMTKILSVNNKIKIKKKRKRILGKPET